VQEKQQAHRNIRHPVEPDSGLPVDRQEAGEDHGAYKAQGEIVGKQFRASHGGISIR
jgi:hypothetical protein